MKPFKFLHAADLHIGNRQYESDERFRDFGRAFQWLLDLAIEKHVDFIIIAGDFFHKSDIKPETFSQVFTILSNFRAKCPVEIPIIAIEGNHDTKPYNTLRSWLQLLAEMGFLYILDVMENKNTHELEFPPVNSKTRRGGTITIGDACIYGSKFLGPSSVHEYLPRYANIILQNPDKFVIFMSHFGISGMDPQKSGVEFDSSFSTLQKSVDYLALGHFHASYQFDNWLYNPGSMESNSIAEYFLLENKNRGVFYVEVTGKSPLERKVELIPPQNRKFIHFSQNIAHFPNFEKASDDLKKKLSELSIFQNSPIRLPKDLEKPVLMISIQGKVAFSRSEINLKEIEQWIEKNLDVLLYRIEVKTESLSDILNLRIDPNLSIQQIENATYDALIQENSMYKPVKNEIIELMHTLKPLIAVKIESPETIIDSIEQWFEKNEPKFNKSDRVKNLSQIESENVNATKNPAAPLEKSIINSIPTNQNINPSVPKKKKRKGQNLDAYN